MSRKMFTRPAITGLLYALKVVTANIDVFLRYRHQVHACISKIVKQSHEKMLIFGKGVGLGPEWITRGNKGAIVWWDI